MEPTVNITFNNLTKVYFPGQPVTGTVQITVYNPVICTAVVIKFNGFAKVRWTENQRNDNGKEEKVVFENKEEYYTMEYRLWGNDNIPSKLYSGKLEYNFIFQLPPNLPSSFESQFGHVRYICTAKLGFPRGKKSIYCTVPLSINSISDLNLDPRASAPILASKSKTLCCLCCAEGDISFVLNISQSGYVPGENIYINAECCNNSRTEINRSTVKIIQITDYCVPGKIKTEKKEVCRMEQGRIKRGEDSDWEAQPMRIPPLPPSELPGCGIINIKYILLFAMVPKGPSFSLSTETPIFIGTVPLQQTFGSFVPSSGGYPDAPPPYECHAFTNNDSNSQIQNKTNIPYEQPGMNPQFGIGGPSAPPYTNVGAPTAPYPNPGPPYPTQGVPNAPYPNPGPPYPTQGVPNAPYPTQGVPNAPYPTQGVPNVPYPTASGSIPQPGFPTVQPYGQNAPTANPPAGFNFPAISRYPNLPLPSYNDCFFGQVVVRHELDNAQTVHNVQWTPQYVTYNLANNPSLVHAGGPVFPDVGSPNYGDNVQLLT